MSTTFSAELGDLPLDRELGVTASKGFRASGIAAGIKAAGAKDLALVVNDGPADVAAGVFTTNKVAAAPVRWSQQVLTQHRFRAVVLNSGCANACTGPEGFQDTHATAEDVAEQLGFGAIDIAVCSTGLIGERLPMDAVRGGIRTAVDSLDVDAAAGLAAATAVMTTDTVPKQVAYRDPAGWSIGGFAKGAGMCAPNMATMLAVITTDAVVDARLLDFALRAAVERTFHRLDVDGSTSTNDTVLLSASGASRINPGAGAFTGALTEVCADLVEQLQIDAEGATKRVRIEVAGADSEDCATRVARTVAEDHLVGTALFGSDPNWGRIAMAVGRSGARVDPDRLDISINGVLLCKNGAKAAERDSADLSGPEIEVYIDLHLGDDSTTVLTTDLSHAYVEENSAYSS
ncbi:bifunctional glutamate N-acetyltransferase/amino-acid acetyltransferase ArgJ [Actinoalloteichus hymeniacidonis]|uniref:Arginine biosynthesis bifunctional protein ArgJ n=1 Tax=Actinoalloteichus hymeniacidonis TaxID=340345 RepID=A0AAC9HSP6_9PSEU|nr:bifunctional glutamate N-acetyltransferase/amino-acid acetyltransferase ArgJ [Actinoalloteichus hymeniacidonis]AOS64421.1 glutamate N-acetyltransferase [Actinoalloteichus hymeniacidonis]MBB5907511.1 glutamate N-acetyltransferase/amino-acid N-acetyltransferase [Actinoalloteichus hymeniacidonis]